MIKLKNILKEFKIELGKVYTEKDRPSFKTNRQMKEEVLSEATAAINTKRELKKSMMLAFNDIFKGKIPKEFHRGDTGEMLLTTETDGRGARVEIVPSTIADAVRELK